MLEGALILLAGIIIGRLLAGRKRPKSPALPMPVCGCDHHHSFHDPETGECHQTVNGQPVHWDKYGITDAWEQARCTCRRYSGPEPLPEYYATEIAGRPGE